MILAFYPVGSSHQKMSRLWSATIFCVVAVVLKKVLSLYWWGWGGGAKYAKKIFPHVIKLPPST